MKGLLALDVATTTGWALWSPGSPMPQFGQQRFEGPIGQFADGFECWLTKLLLTETPRHVYIEAPLTRTKSNLQTTMRLIGAQVLTHKLCCRLAVPLTSISVSAWRTRFIGCSRAPADIKGKYRRRKWLKDTVIAECRRHGWNVESDDAADALGLLSFALEANDIVDCGRAMAA